MLCIVPGSSTDIMILGYRWMAGVYNSSISTSCWLAKFLDHPTWTAGVSYPDRNGDRVGKICSKWTEFQITAVT